MATTETPKRKRMQDVPLLETSQFSFDPNNLSKDDGSTSPRSRVARRFQGLVLEGGVHVGGVRTSRSESPKRITASIDDTMQEDSHDTSRKRVKMADVDMADSFGGTEAPISANPTTALQFALISSSAEPTKASSSAKQVAANQNPAGQEGAVTGAAVHESIIHNPATASHTSTSGGLAGQKPLPPLPKIVGPSGRKRSGTPPLIARTKPSSTSSRDPSEEAERVITDPVRAALTWHEDEITIYDPDDSDDDGTGINGIGFKPTPAIAYARTVKRKKQLAEYRKREERDARARRSIRRRAGASPVPPALVDMKENVEERRVRFLEATPQMIGA